MVPEAQPKNSSIGEAALQPGERVVYPNQGVCRISGIEVKEIGGVKGEFLTMRREEDGATVMIPRSKVASIGLRSVAAREEIERLLAFFATDGEDPELDWKVRHRTNADKMVAGGVLGTAEVLKGLHTLALLRPLPQRERELYDSARHLLVHEVSVALGVSPCTAEDAIDLSLTPIAGSARAKAQADRIAAALDAQSPLDADEDAEEAEEPESAGEEAAETPSQARASAKKAATKAARAKPAAKPAKAKVAAAPPKAAKGKPAKAKAAAAPPKAAKGKPAKRGRK